jgi:hypothetical protein
MITKVRLFLSLKNEAAPRLLGLRRLRRSPAQGQSFDVNVDGRSVRACITRSSSTSKATLAAVVPDVYAEEL